MLSYIKDTLYHTLSISPFSKEVYIENYKVTKYSTPLLVAELGLNHNGSLELAMEMITVAHEAGINAIKLQSYTTETFINKDIEEAKELFNTFKKYELSYEEHQAIARFCKEKNIIFLSTPLSLEWVDKLEALGIAAYKIASGDINNFQLLHKLCSQKNLSLYQRVLQV